MTMTFNILPELKNYTAPSFTTIKRWCQKVGYYKLTRKKVIADDWMVITDASIQMGDKKCLVTVGCRQENLPKNRALNLDDLEILDLKIVTGLNAQVVAQTLFEVKSRIGTIRSICSDRGSDILRGVKDFQKLEPNVRYISDTAHKIANLLEHILENDERWKKFREQTTLARRRMQNSLVAGALPPSPRTKARFMNVDALIKWAFDMLILLDKGISTTDFDIIELKKYLSWLLDCRKEVYFWNILVTIGASARELVRTEGIHMDIVDRFEQTISSLPLCYQELQFANQISLFLLEQSQGLQLEECFLGSTEVLEAFFGKLKHIEKEQTAFGFTSLVLAGIACVGPTNAETVKTAIASIKLSDIQTWTDKEIGESIQSQRKFVRKLLQALTCKIKGEKEIKTSEQFQKKSAGKIFKKATFKMGQKVSGILQGEAVGF